jgi:DNA invertase Pin-like site-specific DNA recombinase
MASKRINYLDEINKIVAEKQGKIIGNYENPFKNLEFQCSNLHSFQLNYANLKKGKWCELCSLINEDLIYTILDKMEIEYVKQAVLVRDAEHPKNFNINDYTFFAKIELDDNLILIDFDNDNVFTDTELQKQINKKVSYCFHNNHKIIRVDNKLLLDENKLTSYINDSLGSDDMVIFSNIEKYDWIELEDDLKEQTLEVENKPQYTPNTNLKDWRVKPLSPYSFILFNPNEEPKDAKVCVGYTRVSSALQRTNNSLPSQQEYILERANALGFYVRRIYTDEGYSAKSISGRPAMLALLSPDDGIQRHENLISFQISRLGRETKDLLDIRDHVLAKGGGVYLSEVDVHVNKSDAFFLYDVMAGISTKERKTISERVFANLQYLRSADKAIHKPKWGYRSVGKGLPLQVNEKEMKVVEEIKKYRGLKMSDHAIAAQLNSMEYKCRKAKAFYHSRVNTIRQQYNIL